MLINEMIYKDMKAETEPNSLYFMESKKNWCRISLIGLCQEGIDNSFFMDFHSKSILISTESILPFVIWNGFLEI